MPETLRSPPPKHTRPRPHLGHCWWLESFHFPRPVPRQKAAALRTLQGISLCRNGSDCLKCKVWKLVCASPTTMRARTRPKMIPDASELASGILSRRRSPCKNHVYPHPRRLRRHRRCICQRNRKALQAFLNAMAPLSAGWHCRDVWTEMVPRVPTHGVYFRVCSSKHSLSQSPLPVSKPAHRNEGIPDLWLRNRPLAALEIARYS